MSEKLVYYIPLFNGKEMNSIDDWAQALNYQGDKRKLPRKKRGFTNSNLNKQKRHTIKKALEGRCARCSNIAKPYHLCQSCRAKKKISRVLNIMIKRGEVRVVKSEKGKPFCYANIKREQTNQQLPKP